MKTFTYQGTVTATQPINHGDGSLGTTTMFRKIKVVQPDGTVKNVPAVSGNSVRGKLRRVSADLWWPLSGHPKLNPDQFRTIWQGGALTKNQKRLPSENVAQIRAMNPHLSLFGWSGGGRIVEGRTKFSGLLPICKETSHITGVGTETSFWEQLDVMDFSRMEDTVRSNSSGAIEDPTQVHDEDTGQMRFTVTLRTVSYDLSLTGLFKMFGGICLSTICLFILLTL